MLRYLNRSLLSPVHRQPNRTERRAQGRRRGKLEVLSLEDRVVPANFTPGDIVVDRVGAVGGGTPSALSTAVFLDEYSPAGILVQTIPLPTAAATAGVNPLTSTGNSTADGLMTLSGNGQYLLVPGYDTIPGDAAVGSSSTSTSTAVSITGATNASPIVLTAASAPATNAIVTISGVTGDTAANGTWFAKNLTTTTFSLYQDAALTIPVAGNAAYISGGAWVTVGVPREVGIVNTFGAINTATTTTSFSSLNIRSVASPDGNAIWMTGSGTGVVYTTAGPGNTSTTISTTTTNLRGAGIAGGQLFVSSASGTLRLGTVGTGLPTNAGNTITNLPGLTTPASPYGFFFANLGSGNNFDNTGMDTVYVADNSTGIQKWSYNGTIWTQNGTGVYASSSDKNYEGLTGVVNGTTVTLYATTNNRALVQLVDASGYGNSITATPIQISTAATNTNFRGVAFAPSSAAAAATSEGAVTPDANPEFSTAPFNLTVSTTGIPANATVDFEAIVNGAFVLKGTGTVNAAGTSASGSVTMTAGSYTVVAYYPGDATHAASYSATPSSANVTVVTPSAPIVTNPTSLSVSTTSETLGATIANMNYYSTITQRGVVYAKTSLNPNPQIGGANVTVLSDSQSATGNFSFTATGLTPATGYSFEAYATDGVGTTYTAASTFTTTAPVAPTVTTPTSASITATTATLGGNLTSNGGAAITDYGVIYSLTSLNANPTLTGSNVTIVSDGANGNGVFTANATGLTDTSGYSFVAYATNSVGTSYSPVSTFTTLAPSVAGTLSNAGSFQSSGEYPTSPTSYTLIEGSAYTYPSFSAEDFTVTPPTTPTSVTGLTFSVGENYAATTDLGGTVDFYLAGTGTSIPYSSLKYHGSFNGEASLDPQLSPVGLDAGGPLGQGNYTPSSANSGVLTFTLSSATLLANPTLANDLLGDLQSGSLRILLAPDTATTSYEIKGFTATTGRPSLSVTYTDNPVAPSVTTPTSMAITNSSATLGGDAIADGGAAITARGVVYAKTSLNANPTLTGANVTILTDASGGPGVFTESASSLAGSTGYSFAAYATNSVGTTYSPVSTFFTYSNNPVIPTVSSPTFSAVGGFTATLGGSVTADGGAPITARGVVYAKTSDNANPTLTGSNVTVLTDSSDNLGAFTESATGLAELTGYSFVAYATNSAGTAYSPVSTFTTTAPNFTGNWINAATVENGGPYPAAPTTTSEIAGSSYNYPSFNAEDFSVTPPTTPTSVTGLTFSIPESYSETLDIGGTVDVYLAGNGTSYSYATLEHQGSANGLAGIDPQVQPVGLDAGGPIAQVSYTPSAANTGALTFTLSSATLLANPILANDLLGDLQGGSLRLLLAADTAATSYQLKGFTAPIPPAGATLSINYSDTPVAPSVTMPNSSAITQTTATLGGTALADGGAAITTRGVVYAKTSQNANPQIGGANVTVLTDASGGTGAFTENAINLAPSTGYSFVAFATNSAGTTYTPVSTFTTFAVVAVAPTVTAPTATAITGFTATLGGDVTADGGAAITARGVVYALTSDNPSPTLGGYGTTTLTDAAASTGIFTESATGLTALAGYSYVAYATNSAGTTYTSPVSTFTTAAPSTTGTPQISQTVEDSGPNGTGAIYTDIDGTTNPGTGSWYPSFAVEQFTVTVPSGTPSATAITSLTFTAHEHYYAGDDNGGTVDVYLASGTGATIALTAPVKHQSGHNALAAIDPQLMPVGLDAGGPIAQMSYTPSSGNTGVLSFTLTSTVLAANPTLAYDLLNGLQNGSLRFLLAADTATTAYEIGGYQYSMPPALSIVYSNTPVAPVVTAPTAVPTSQSTATLGGDVDFDGGSPITARGVVYAQTSVNANPSITDSNATVLTDAANSEGVFTESATGLMASTGYSFRAFATNALGTTYTPVSTFTSLTPTTLALTSNTAQATVGGTVTFTATLSSSGGLPTGTVTFFANGTAIDGPITVNGTNNGVITYSAPVSAIQAAGTIQPGINDILALYLPTGTFGSSSGEIPQPVKPNAIGSGDSLVYRVGDGVNSLTANGNRLYIDDYSNPTPGTANTSVLVQSIVMPTIASGANKPVLADGSASTDGQLTLSADSQYAYFTGYDALPTNTETLSTSSPTDIPRIVGRINLSTGAIDTSLAISNLTANTSIDGIAAAANGSIYLADASGELYYVSSYAGTATPLGSASSWEGLHIFGSGSAAQLYGANAAGPILATTPALPTDSTPTFAPLPGLQDGFGDPLVTSPVDFYLTKLGTNSGVSYDTLYISSSAGSITKWSLVGGQWTQTGSPIAPPDTTSGVDTDFDWLTGKTSGSTVTLAITSGGGGNGGGGTVWTLSDAAGFNQPIAASLTQQVQVGAASNETFRGILTAPTTAAPTVSTVEINNSWDPVGQQFVDQVQRSRVTSILVTFNGPVTTASFATTPITITRTTAAPTSTGLVNQVLTYFPNGTTASDASAINISQSLDTSSPDYTGPDAIRLTFTVLNITNQGGANPNLNPVNDAVQYGSLADGYWTLAIGSFATPNNDNSTDSSGHHTGLYRLFGDINADLTVDALGDQLPFGAAFGSSVGDPNYVAAFDFNGDGTIDALGDQLAFGGHFGVTLS